MNMYTRLLSYLMIIIGFTGCARFNSEMSHDFESRTCSANKLMLDAIARKRHCLESPTSPQLNMVDLSEAEIKTLYPKGKPAEVQAVGKFVGENFVPGKRYKFVQIRLNDKVIELGKISVNDDGMLFSERDNRRLGTVAFDFVNYINGEEARYVLIPEDDSEYVAAITVPNPIELKWKDGAKVSVICCSPTIGFFFVSGQGFTPGEKLSVISSDGKEEKPIKVTINENGRWEEINMLIFEGSDVAKLKVKRESDSKEQIVDYAYGIQENIRRMLKA